jgi:hypothetical protein
LALGLGVDAMFLLTHTYAEHSASDIAYEVRSAQLNKLVENLFFIYTSTFKKLSTQFYVNQNQSTLSFYNKCVYICNLILGFGLLTAMHWSPQSTCKTFKPKMLKFKP